MVISGIRPHELMLHKPLVNRREWIGSLRLAECQPYIDLLFKQHAASWRDINMNDILPLLHSGENQIEYNDISRVMLRLEDGNAIYLSCMGIKNHLVGNYIHEFFSEKSNPMRLDDNSTFTYFENNVCYGSKKGIAFKASAEVCNNFFINVEDASIGGHSNNKILFKSNLLCRRLGKNDKGSPTKRGFWQSPTDKPSGYINCLYFDALIPSGIKPGDILITSIEPNKSKIGLEFGNPMFDQEAMKKKIFRFMPGSPCEKLGIKPLDLSSVGSAVQDPL
jgi:hypothetical protein